MLAECVVMCCGLCSMGQGGMHVHIVVDDMGPAYV